MDYTSFPSVNGLILPSTANNQVSANNFYGTGSLGGASGLSFGGNGGINGAQGIWLGSNQFSSAPFSVDLKGNIKATTLTLTGFIKTGGAAADINGNVTTVNGNKITGATITSSQIASSTIVASNIVSGTITATQIANSTITASKIANATITSTQIANSTITGTQIASSTITGGLISGATITGSNIASSTITASNLSVGTLSAISANLGTVTAGSITGVTITGGMLQTATSGQRVVVDGSSNEIDFYSSTGTNVGTISGGVTGGFNYLNIGNFAGSTFISLYSGTASIQIDNANHVNINCSSCSVIGNFSVTGTKAFDIPHPTKEGMRLKYIATEAPEALVMCRGKGEKPELPQHFIDVSEPDSIEYIIGDDGKGGKNWLATAVRKGYANFEPEYTPSK